MNSNSKITKAAVKFGANGEVKTAGKVNKADSTKAVKMNPNDLPPSFDTEVFSLLHKQTGNFANRYSTLQGGKAERSEFNEVKNEIYSGLSRLDSIKFEAKYIKWLLDSAYMTAINTLDKARGGDGNVTLQDVDNCRRFNFALFREWDKAGSYRQFALMRALSDGLCEWLKTEKTTHKANDLDEFCGELLYQEGIDLFPSRANEITGEWGQIMFSEWIQGEQDKIRGTRDYSATPLTTI